MKKRVISVVIAFLLVLTVLTAGCMTSQTSKNLTQAPSTMTTKVTAQASSISTSNATTVRDATLEKFVSAMHEDMQENFTLVTSNVKWLNATTVTLTFTVKKEVDSTSVTVDQNRTIIHFKSTSDATDYLNGLDRTGYKPRADSYPGGFYSQVVGHNPTVFKWYQKQSNENTQFIYQLDDTIVIETLVANSS